MTQLILLLISLILFVNGSDNDWDYKCLRLPDLTEHCKYNGICFDGTKYIIRDGTGLVKEKLLKFDTATEFGDHLFTIPENLKSVEETVRPWNIKKIQLTSVPSDEWDLLAKQSTFLDEAYFITLDSPRSRNHQYLFTRSVSMLIDPQLHNTTYGQWFPALTNVVVNDNKENIFAPNVEILKQISLPESTIHFVGEGKTPVCAKTGVIEGYRNTIFRGSRDALFWKRRVYDSHNIIGRKMSLENLYPLNVLLFNPTHSRHFENPSVDQIIHQLTFGPLSRRNGTRVNSFDIHVYNEDQLHSSFSGLVNAFAEADIIIMPHDAAVTYTMFADVHVPFIEIFPYNYLHDAYRRLTNMCTRSYFEMMANPTSIEFYGPNETTESLCSKWAPSNSQSICLNDIHKFSPLHINMTILERMVTLAIEASPLSASPTRRSSANPVSPPPIIED